MIETQDMAEFMQGNPAEIEPPRPLTLKYAPIPTVIKQYVGICGS